MRRSVEANPVSRRVQQLGGRRGSGSLPIGAGNLETPKISLGISKTPQKRLHPLQAELDGEGVKCL